MPKTNRDADPKQVPTARIVGLLAPWHVWLRPTTRVEVWSRAKGGPVGRPARPDDAGRFGIDLELTEDLAKGLAEGDLVVRAVGVGDRGLGQVPLIGRPRDRVIPVSVPLYFDR